MKRYSVDVPISGYINIEVEADTEEDAIRTALESDDLKIDNVVEWEAHEKICEGNVCNAIFWEAEATEIN
jgi:hypothetical protein